MLYDTEPATFAAMSIKRQQGSVQPAASRPLLGSGSVGEWWGEARTVGGEHRVRGPFCTVGAELEVHLDHGQELHGHDEVGRAVVAQGEPQVADVHLLLRQAGRQVGEDIALRGRVGGG